ncbi:ribonuclease Oy-like [Saccoglossus kowalevskii]
MRMETTLKSVVLLVLTMSCCNSFLLDDEWDHFVYAQQWPQTVCLDNDGQVNQTTKCSILQEVKTWVVHGLWPTRVKTEGPNCCGCNETSSGCHNCTRPFNFTLIQDLEPQLNEFWPNLLTKKHGTPYDFWKHEWEKHGTCGTSLDVINSQHKYFVMGLKLNQKFDILQAFLKHNIKPSLKVQYTYKSVMDALIDTFGHQPLLECYYSHTTNTSNLESIEFCVSKNFDIMTCPSRNNINRLYREETCWTKENITIPPLVYSNPIKVKKDITVKLLEELN